MLPRYSADYRTLLWALLMLVVALAQYARPDLIVYLSPLSFYFAVSAGVISSARITAPPLRLE